jgi:site-specific recombinase XerD
LQDYINRFITYLKTEKNSSPHTTGSYGLDLNKLKVYLESRNILSFGEVTTALLREFIYNLKESRNLCPSSVCKLIATIKSFFNYLYEEDLIKTNPSKKLKGPKKNIVVPKCLSKYEVERVIDSIKFPPARCRKNYIRDKLIISMLYYTGIRRSELLSLNWDDLNLEKSFLTVRNGKGGKSRVIPLHPTLVKLIDDYLTLRLPLKCNALFIGEQGKRLTRTSFANLINMYMSISGLKKKGYTAHSFRHSFATHLVESGVDIFKLQRLLGHSSLDVTKIYINFDSSSMAEAVSRLT